MTNLMSAIHVLSEIDLATKTTLSYIFTELYNIDSELLPYIGDNKWL